MARHLILRLDAPLMSFGAEMVDAYGVVRDFPARSAITGLIANALGWERYEAESHDRLQARLIMGSARVAEGRRIRDYQTALLGADDEGWTTLGRPDGRNKTSSSFSYDWGLHRRTGCLVKNQTHERFRDADADACLLVALRLDPTEETPTLDDVAAALDQPERPLFIGRKPFLPSGPINGGFRDGATIADALAAALGDEGTPFARAQWPIGEGPETRAPMIELTDERNWLTGVHAGLRRVIEGKIAAVSPADA